MEKPRIFISYSSKDRQTAEIIHEKLGSSGLDAWRDKTRLETDWSREIAQALADSDVLCLLWSEQSAKSKWVKHEWLTARALEKTIILCRLPEAPASPEPLHNLQEVNLENPEKGSQDLIGRLESKQDFTKKYDYTVLPKNSYIPFNPNPNFTGRGQDLLELYLKLIGNLNKIGINQVGTVGMGGIGKTQLVVEFAYRFSFAFDSVHWIQAADERKWLRQFVELARDQLQLSIDSDPDKSEADKQYIYALRKYCKENPDTLIVMDNVAEPKLLNSDSFLFGLTPLTLGCDLLFTTRKHFRLPGVSSQPVNILSQEGAYKLLASYRKPHTPDEQKHAASVCNAVGYLPLAIVLAGAFLNRYESEISFGDYHEELLKSRLGTIDTDEISEEELATRHEAAVTTTLKNQWEMLDDEDGRVLFKLAGQFPEADIIPKGRLGLLSGIGPGKSKLDQPLAKAFNLLQDLNLVEKLEGDASAIRLHPLVRAFSIRLLPEQQGATLKAVAAMKLRTAIFKYSRLQNELDKRGIRQLLGDIEVAIGWWGENTEGLRELELLHDALRLSFHQLDRDPNQLTTQLFGRLASRKESEIKQLVGHAAMEQERVWLRPLTSSLTPPGGALLRTLEGHSAVVFAVAIAPNSKSAVSASFDGTLKVWDLNSGEVLQTLEGHGNGVRAVAIAPDGKTAVSASWDKTLKVWDQPFQGVHFSP
jgi:hypothetical protein